MQQWKFYVEKNKIPFQTSLPEVFLLFSHFICSKATVKEQDNIVTFLHNTCYHNET